MRGLYRCVHSYSDCHPWFESVSNLQYTTLSFCVQVWCFEFYRLNGSQIAKLTLDSKLTPVLCHHWQVGDVGCGHGVWTPVMKIHGDKVWEKKHLFFICFLQSFCLNLRDFQIPSWLACCKETHCLEKRYKFTWSRSEGDGGIRNNNNNNNNK